MTRYYTENPQVTYWREKAEKLERKVVFLNNQCFELDKEVKLQHEAREKEQEIYKRWDQIDKGRMKESFMNFNSLPWYKKMFFKFKL